MLVYKHLETRVLESLMVGIVRLHTQEVQSIFKKKNLASSNSIERQTRRNRREREREKRELCDVQLWCVVFKKRCF